MNLRRILALMLALALAAALGGCGLSRGGETPDEPSRDGSAQDESRDEDEEDPEFPVYAGGAELTTRPGKVVSLAPALTEKLHDLALIDALVGVSDYCDYPRRAAALPACGTAQLPDVDEILALDAHLVLTEAPLPDEALDRLAEAEIPVAVLPHAGSVDELLDTYIDLARLLEGDLSGRLIGEAAADEYRDRLGRLTDLLADYTAEQGRKTALYLRLMPFTAATGDTFENELLDAVCLDNIAAPYTGWEYPESDARGEGAAEFAALDLIFLDEAFVTIKDLEGSDFYKSLPVTLEDRYLYISSLLLERQSLRSLDQLAAMAEYAYPDAAPPGGFAFSDAADREPGGDPEPEKDLFGGDEEARAEGEDMLAALDDMYGDEVDGDA